MRNILKESDIQKSILDYLSLIPGCFVFRTNNIGVPLRDSSGKTSFRPSPVKGLSDILCCFKGRFIALEVKRPKGKVTQHQTRFLNQVKESGGVGAVVHSIEEVKELFEYIPCLDEEICRTILLYLIKTQSRKALSK
jgi:penicillin-binding protein-related factor A (putative recombinase)